MACRRSQIRAAPLIGSCANLHVHSTQYTWCKHVHCFFSRLSKVSTRVIFAAAASALHANIIEPYHYKRSKEWGKFIHLSLLLHACAMPGRPQAVNWASCWTAIYCLVFRCRFFHERRTCGSAIITITKVNWHCLTREEGLEKSKCIPPKTYPPNFIANSHRTRRPQFWKEKKRNSGLNRKILMPEIIAGPN